MNDESRQGHWEKVYSDKEETEVSWFQQSPETSLRLIAELPIRKSDGIIDVGGEPQGSSITSSSGRSPILPCSTYPQRRSKSLENDWAMVQPRSIRLLRISRDGSLCGAIVRGTIVLPIIS